MREDLRIGFIGNPNCGKTTLFNAFTGAKLKVANWPGVTVEKVEGAMKYHGHEFKLVDLPGIYSLTSYTMEEQVSRQYILSDEVDVIIDVVDASALERNLYLTLQLLELGKPVIMALNMMDIVEKRGMEIDLHRFPEMLGIPVIPVSARKRAGLDILIHAAEHHKDSSHPEGLEHNHSGVTHHKHNHHKDYAMVYSDEIEDKIDQIKDVLKANYPEITNHRWVALKLLEQDPEITAKYPVNLPEVLDRSYETDIINQKYDFIQEIVEEVVVNKAQKAELTDHVDRFLTHRILGIPIFLCIMALVFLLTFTVGDWLKGYVELLMELISGAAGDGLTALHVRPEDHFSGDGWHHCRSGRHADLPSEYFHPVSGPGFSGGQRLYGESGLCHGRHHGKAGTFRPGFYPHDSGLWLQRSGADGLKGAGKSERPLPGHAGDTVYVL